MILVIKGPTSGPAGHTPYPVPGGGGYFSPPNSNSSVSSSNIPPVGGSYAGNPAQQAFYSNLGPEGGAIPLGYGSGAPPPMKVPNSTGPPVYPTAGGGFPDPSSYGVNPFGAPSSGDKPPPYYQQPPSSDYKSPESLENHGKENK